MKSRFMDLNYLNIFVFFGDVELFYRFILLFYFINKRKKYNL